MKAGLLLVLVLVPRLAGRGVDVWRFDDFEDSNLEAGPGLNWIVIADDQLGGSTEARIANGLEGAAGTKRSLRFEGVTRGGTPRPFAGVFAPLDGEGLLVDLSAYRGVRFQARGSGSPFRAGFRRGAAASSSNFMAEFRPAGAWQRFEVAFDGLSQTPPASPPLAWSSEDVGWIGFTTGSGAPGAFWLEVDEIELLRSERSGTRVSKVHLGDPSEAARLEWRDLAADASGDGRYPGLPDASGLSFAVDRERGLLWFSIALSQAPPGEWLGVNVAIDSDENGENGLAWWGFNKSFRFDRLLSAYLSRSGDEYQGVVGIADAAGVSAFDFTNLGSRSVSVAVDREARRVLVAAPLETVDPDGRFRLIATVGSAFVANDDVPDEGFAAIRVEK
jgi:hypothetical protein